MYQDHLRLFANLFVSRRDDYAIQQVDGRYLRAGRPMTYSTLLRRYYDTCTVSRPLARMLSMSVACAVLPSLTMIVSILIWNNESKCSSRSSVGCVPMLSLPTWKGRGGVLTCGSSAHGWCLLPSCGVGSCLTVLLGSSFIPNRMRAHGSMARWSGCLWGCIAGPIAAIGSSPGTMMGGSTWFPLLVVSLSRWPGCRVFLGHWCLISIHSLSRRTGRGTTPPNR
jgi:hypothetical protein